MKNLNKKMIITSLLSLTLLYGDTVSTALQLLSDDKKNYEELEKYGVVSAGFEQIKIDLLKDDIEVERGTAKKLDIHLYGYSIYSRYTSNYIDFTFITPNLFNEGYDYFSKHGGMKLNTDSQGSKLMLKNEGKVKIFLFNGSNNSNYGNNKKLSKKQVQSFKTKIRGLLKYKSFKYNGIEDNGKINIYTAGLSTDMFTVIDSFDFPSKFSILFPKISFVELDSDHNKFDAKYYSLGMGISYDWIEYRLISDLSLGKKLPYGFRYSLFDIDGSFEYVQGSGKNLNFLLKEKNGMIGKSLYKPSIYFTFPIGYLKLSYSKDLYLFFKKNTFSQSGFNFSAAMIF